jgi:pimeloyl-ACP methyl ester carboxylesterase
MAALVIPAAAAALAAGGLGFLATRYRRDLAEARRRLDRVERHTVPGPGATIEYAEAGTGDPVLISHGIFHGCDGGLLSVRDTVQGRRVVVPSRFGYLGSDMPAEASAAAQADAFAALLDHLAIGETAVVGISAGTGPALQMSLRHPGRVSHLVISSGNWPGSPTAQAPPGWARAFYSDRAMWTLETLVPPMMGRLMGVPRSFPRDAADAARMAEMLDSIFPIGPRREGAVFDAFVSNPEVGGYPLEDLAVPTLVIHARDDPLASHDAAAAAAGRIPEAVFVSLTSGGHLGLGQTDRIRDEISAFLAR